MSMTKREARMVLALLQLCRASNDMMEMVDAEDGVSIEDVRTWCEATSGIGEAFADARALEDEARATLQAVAVPDSRAPVAL